MDNDNQGIAMTTDGSIQHAWNQVADVVRAAGDAVVADGAISDRDRADGARFLTRLASAAFDMLVEYGDASRPGFVRLMGPHRKFFGDNPDADYDFACVDGQHTYRITGVRGSSEYLALCVYGHDADDAARIVGNLSDREITFGEDGSFTLYLSPNPPTDGAGDWIELAPDADTAIIRQYFLNRDKETPARFEIECLDGPTGPSRTGGATGAMISSVAEFVGTGAKFSAAAATMLATRPNELTIDSQATAVTAFYPTPDNKYLAGWYRLDPGQALVIEGRPPQARYWSVLLMNRWMESLDTGPHPTKLNKADVALSADGGFRVVVSDTDPGVPNWLDTQGRPEGYVMFRWMQADEVERPTLRVVPVTELAAPGREPAR
jgi:hypothetical protein